MFIAQAIQVTSGQVGLGILAVILVKGLDWFKEYLADRKDARSEETKRVLEEDKTEFLRRIADATSRQNSLLAELNKQIAVEKATTDERHFENKIAIALVCKYKEPK